MRIVNVLATTTSGASNYNGRSVTFESEFNTQSPGLAVWISKACDEAHASPT